MNVLAEQMRLAGEDEAQASRRDQDTGAAELHPRHKLQGIMLPHRLSWSPRAFPTAWTQPPHAPLSSSSQGLFCYAGH